MITLSYPIITFHVYYSPEKVISLTEQKSARQMHVAVSRTLNENVLKN